MSDDEDDRHGYSQPTRAQYDALRAERDAANARLAKVRLLAEAARASVPNAPYTGLSWAAVLDILAAATPEPVLRACGMSQLAELHARYLAERQHTINQTTPAGQARYVLGEARELEDAVLIATTPPLIGGEDEHVRHEIADVALSLTTLAKMLGVTVEDCIAEKTAADRGRR